MAEKLYHATTGVDEFYYGVLDPSDETVIVKSLPERIKFLQEISVSANQELAKAFGDNSVAEIATSNGEVEVSGKFHKIPKEDLITILGLETTESGLFAYGKDDNPPYVAVVFARTYEDGSKEWVGLPKGKFIRPENSSQTKEDGVEFSSDEIEAQFMDRKVKGFNGEKSTVFAVTKKGETVARDELFDAIFGRPYPDGQVDDGEQPIE